MSRHLAVIPARSGSKGISDKNIKELGGKPLMAYSIEAALNSGLFSEVMVSTDSERYAEIGKAYGASIPFLRSHFTASDEASSWDAVREVVGTYRERGDVFDTVCLLQPTSPLRNAGDIQDAYRIYEDRRASTVVSVCETEQTPLFMNTLPENHSLDHFIGEGYDKRRQELATYYRLNGAIYIVDADFIMSHKYIYENSFAYIMPRERSVDIDDEWDFRIAEAFV